MTQLIDAYALDVLLLLGLGWWLLWSLRKPHGARDNLNRNTIGRAVDALMAVPDRTHFSALRQAADMGPSPDLEHGLAEIRRHDPRFDPEFFLASVRHVQDEVMTAYAARDRHALACHVSREALEIFNARLEARERQGDSDALRVMDIAPPEILDAGVVAGSAWIVVRCISRVADVACEAAGPLVPSEPCLPAIVVDAWVFARDVGAPRTTWKLIAVSPDVTRAEP